MRRLAYLMLRGDRDRAEDVVHDAFIRAASRLPTLRDPERFAAYFRRSVVNGVSSVGRRRVLESRWLAGQRRLPAGGVQDVVEDVAGTAAVVELLGTLPARQRLAVTARICLDLSEPQTAELMSCSVGTVKSLTSRGLASLRAAAAPTAAPGPAQKTGKAS